MKLQLQEYSHRLGNHNVTTKWNYNLIMSIHTSPTFLIRVTTKWNYNTFSRLSARNVATSMVTTKWNYNTAVVCVDFFVVNR